MKYTALAFGILCAATLCAADLFEGAPPAPPGYETHEEARGAVLSGQVPIVTPPGKVPDTVSFHDDVVYATPGGVELSLDIFVPKELQGPAPCLLFIHGGGWRGGKKEDYLYYNLEFAKLGYVTASVQYRLSPGHTFPAAVQDVKCAIAWLKENASTYNIDPGAFAVLGGSAGGHLSLMAAYAQDPGLACPTHPDADTTVQAVVNLYGVTDCTTPVAQAAKQVIDFIGAPYTEAKEKYELASPLFHLDKNDPPTLTFHGTIDELVPVSQADRLHEQLDALGVPNYYDRIEGWPHTMDITKPINDRCRHIIRLFLEKHLHNN